MSDKRSFFYQHLPTRENINLNLSLETEKAVMSSHIEVPARRYRIRFMTIISCGWLRNR